MTTSLFLAQRDRHWLLCDRADDGSIRVLLTFDTLAQAELFWAALQTLEEWQAPIRTTDRAEGTTS